MNNIKYRITTITESYHKLYPFEFNSPKVTHSVTESVGGIARQNLIEVLKDAIDAPDRRLDDGQSLAEYYNYRLDRLTNALEQIEFIDNDTLRSIDIFIPKEYRSFRGNLHKDEDGDDYTKMEIHIEKDNTL